MRFWDLSVGADLDWLRTRIKPHRCCPCWMGCASVRKFTLFEDVVGLRLTFNRMVPSAQSGLFIESGVMTEPWFHHVRLRSLL